MAEYKLTEDLYWKAIRLSQSRLRRAIAMACLFFVTVLLILFFNSRGGLDWGTFTPFLILLLVLWVFLPVLQRWQVKRIYAQQKGLHDLFTLKLTDEALEWSGANGTARIPWSDVYRWKSNQHLTIIYESEALMRMIPHTALNNSEKELLRAKLQTIKKA